MVSLTLLLVVVSAPGPSARACVDTTDPPRPFATCFDPWRGLWLAGGGGWRTAALEPSLSLELRLRRERESRSKTDSTWLSVHRLGALSWHPRSGSVDASAWEFLFRRHASDTSLTLPTIPVTRLPFPFDIGLGGSVARFEWAARSSEQWALETARVAFLFDPVRSETNQFHLAFGPVAQHRLAAVAGGALQHDVTPLTAGLLLFSAETDDGHGFVRGTTLGGAVMTLDGATMRWSPQLRSQVEAGLVLLAVNDQPLSLSARGEAWLRGGAPPEWSASLSLGVRLFSARRG